MGNAADLQDISTYPSVMEIQTSPNPALRIPDEPDDPLDFEDMVAALFAASRWHVSQNIRSLDGKTELLEADIVATQWEANGNVRRVLVECKSGDWGFRDMYTLLGHKTYLGVDNAFLYSRSGQEKASVTRHNQFAALGCHAVVIGGSQKPAQEIFEGEAIGSEVDTADVRFWRRVFQLRRLLLKSLHTKNPGTEATEAIRLMKLQKLLVEDGLFAHPDAFSRLESLTDGYQNHSKLARRTAHLLDSSPEGSSQNFTDAMYGNGHPLVYAAMFLDCRARLATLTAVVDFLLTEDDATSTSKEITRLLGLPSSMNSAIVKLRARSQLHLYPIIWQRFVYELGGMILDDLESEEMAHLATACGANIGTIKEALGVWDILFPLQGGSWLTRIGGERIQVLKMVPAPIQGLGALRRQRMHEAPKPDGLAYFSSFTDVATATFLKRVNNIAYHLCNEDDCPDHHLSVAKELDAKALEPF